MSHADKVVVFQPRRFEIKRFVALAFVNFLLRCPGHAFRIWVLRSLAGFEVGRSTSVERYCRITSRGGVRIGSGSNIGRNVLLDGRGGLVIGSMCDVAADVRILTAGHDPSSRDFAFMTAPVVIGSRVWLATASIVLPGRTLGETCAVGAGSVVTRDVQARAIVAGSPARVVGRRPPDAQTELRPYRRFWH